MVVHYRSLIMDSARWDGFEFRPSDIVISTPPKCGTTWTQMLCAMLIFDGPTFPAPLSELTPWLDQSIRPLDDVRAIYAAQEHRRFIKTHTPLDGLSLVDDVTYVVVGRDPRDVMISMEHHLANMDLDRVLALRGQAVGNDDLDTLPPRPQASDDPAERFRAFVHASGDTGALCLTSVLHHLDTGWQLRHAPNVVLCHYADYTRDLPGEIMRLAKALNINMTPDRAQALAAEATLERMRDRAADVLPNAGAIWRDDRAFFRAGSFGEWRSRVTDHDLVEYQQTVDAVVTPELASWAHQGRIASGLDPADV
jgi:Sulfotransferase domain